MNNARSTAFCLRCLTVVNATIAILAANFTPVLAGQRFAGGRNPDLRSQARIHRAFTLIELLVVIAIISILAAVLFPVFATAREKARQTSCASNLKQLGVAFIQYEQDYDETMPPGWWGSPQSWAGRIYTYVKSVNVYDCPDDPDAPMIYNGAYQIYPISYAENSDLTGAQIGSGPYDAGYVLSQFTSPASTVLLAEVQSDSGAAHPLDVLVNQLDEGTNSWHGNPGWGWNSPATNYCETQGYNGGAVWIDLMVGSTPTVSCALSGSVFKPARHTAGSNYLAADGHVKYLLSTQVSAGPAGTLGQPQQSTYPYAAAATDTLFLDASKTQRVTLTFSPV